MQFGIFSNGQRYNQLAADTYDDDLHEIVVADEAGFAEAWVSEHFGGPAPDQLAVPELFMMKAAGLTKQIKLGPAVRLLALYHPLDVATSAATCDQLTRGRYLFGFGTGTQAFRNMERRGLANDQRGPLVYESLEYVLKAWTSEGKFDWDGPHWAATDLECNPKPYQQPHPPLAMATENETAWRYCGERGISLLIGPYDSHTVTRRTAEIYREAAASAGQPADNRHLRVSHFVLLGETDAEAHAAFHADLTRDFSLWRKMGVRYLNYWKRPGQEIADLTFEQVCEDDMFIVGSPDTAARKLRAWYDAVGGFGTLLVVGGKDWGTREARDRSLRLFMRHVAPQLADLDPATSAAREPAGVAGA